VQHLFTNIVKTARNKRNIQQAKTHVDHLLFQLVDDMHSMCDANFFLDRAQELVTKAIDEQADYNTVELDRSHPVKKGAVTRRRLWTRQHTHDEHKLRRKVDVWQIAEA